MRPAALACPNPGVSATEISHMSYCAWVTDTYLDQIGGLIRDARKHRGLTQTQLADVLGTSQSAVHRIEAGRTEP